jgi:hypothetical protein
LYSKVELRRFRCFEHTAIISYARPFITGPSEVPRLSLKRIGANLIKEEIALHARVLKLRNKLVAHSDLEIINFASKAEPLDEVVGKPFLQYPPVTMKDYSSMSGAISWL